MQWNSEEYNKNAAYVSEYGREVLGLLAPKPGERILDIGAGEGTLAAAMTDAGAKVFCIDPSVDMVAALRSRGLSAACLRAEDLESAWEGGFLNFKGFYSYVNSNPPSTGTPEPTPSTDPRPYHAVFSNAALHWVQDMPAALRGIHCVLRAGGRFCAEFGAEGNVAHFVQALYTVLGERGIDAAPLNPWYFPSKQEFVELLEQQGFRILHAHVFERPTPLPQGTLAWLNTFAQSFLREVPENEHEALLTKVAKNLESTLHHENGVYQADYVRIRVLAEKS